MSTKPNPSLTLTLCAIVDVAPAAANTIWIMTLRCTTRVYLNFVVQLLHYFRQGEYSLCVVYCSVTVALKFTVWVVANQRVVLLCLYFWPVCVSFGLQLRLKIRADRGWVRFTSLQSRTCVCVCVNEQHEEQSDLAMSPVPQRNGSLLTRLPTYRWGLFQQWRYGIVY